MSVLPLLLPLLATPAAAVGPTPTFPASVEGNVAAGPVLQGGASRGTSAGGELALDWHYRRPAVDDASPFGLQAYLQRLDTVSLGLQAGSFDTESEREENRSRTLSARLGWLRYWRRYLFAGEVSYARIDERQRSSGTGTFSEVSRQAHRVVPALSFGLRDRTFELRATYRLPGQVAGGTSSVSTWRAVVLSVRLVPESSQSFSLQLYTLPDNGAGAAATYEYLHGQRLSFWLRGQYESGQLHPGSECVDSTRYGGAVGFGHWLSNRFQWRFSIGANARRAVCERQEIHDVSPAYGRGDALVEVLATVGIVTRIAGSPRPPPEPVPPTATPPSQRSDELRILELSPP